MENTGGSLLLAVLMHSSINQTKDIVSSKVSGADHMWALSSSTVGWITVALLWICAGYFLFRMSRRNLHEPVPGAARSLRPGTR